MPAQTPFFISALPLSHAYLQTSPFKSSSLSKRPSPRPALRITMVSRVAPGTELSRPPPSSLAPTGPLTPAQISHFFEQGYVIVPSLVPAPLLQRMRSAIPKIEAAKLGFSNALYDNLSFRVWSHDDAFKEFALSSPVPAAAAQLTPTTPDSRGLVVLKDAYFRLQGDNVGCGFHVDDPYFWPAPRDAPGPGVNAWVALHDVGDDRGGLTIAPRSHLPGFVDHRKAIEMQTCLLAEIDPKKNEELEAISISPKMKAGDVILHTRWLFHRGNPFRKGSDGEKGEGIARYSVRYMPAEAKVQEVAFVDGKVEWKTPVLLQDADPVDFPAVQWRRN